MIEKIGRIEVKQSETEGKRWCKRRVIGKRIVERFIYRE